jgi:hypothetical protein
MSSHGYCQLIIAIREGWDDIFAQALDPTFEALCQTFHAQQQQQQQRIASSSSSLKIIDQSSFAYGGARALIDDAAFGAFVVRTSNHDDDERHQSSENDDGKWTRIVATADKSSIYWHLESKVALGQWSKHVPGICPESYTFAWDHDLLQDVHLAELFAQQAESTSSRCHCCCWVLKRDGASGAVDVHFVTSVAEVVEHVEQDQLMQEALPMFNDRADSIAGWALQRFIDNPLLLALPQPIDDQQAPSLPLSTSPSPSPSPCQTPLLPSTPATAQYKFHIRTFVLVVRGRVWLYDRYEVRFAESCYSNNVRDRDAQVTNGGGKVHNRRTLADLLLRQALSVEQSTALQRAIDSIPTFIKQTMLPLPESLDRSLPQYQATLCTSLNQQHCTHQCHDYALLAHDLLPDDTGKLWLLETNHCPGAPPLPTCYDADNKHFRQHLLLFVQQLTTLLAFGKQDLQAANRFIDLGAL